MSIENGGRGDPIKWPDLGVMPSFGDESFDVAQSYREWQRDPWAHGLKIGLKSVGTSSSPSMGWPSWRKRPSRRQVSPKEGMSRI